MIDEFVNVVVIGSGFGGAVTACRVAEAGRKVLVLERGTLYRPEKFPQRPLETPTNLWDPSEGLFGVFQVWSFRHLDVVVSSGVGGDSLIYDNVMSRMSETWFGANAQDWPLEYSDIEEHYGAVEKMMDAEPAPLAVTFSYLSQAQRCGAEVRPLHEVKRITAITGGYELDYVVHRPAQPPSKRVRRPSGERPAFKRIRAKTAVVAAGALGSTWLLLANRPGLPRLSGQLGRGFSGLDPSLATMRLHNGRLDLDWLTDGSREYVRDVWKTMTMRGRASDSRLRGVFSSLRSRNSAARPLGGCPMGKNAAYGVVDRHGEAFGHPGLFVADGSVLPAPVGANPALTIAALAERFAHKIVERSQ